MKQYKVYISREARADLKEIADYIADKLKAPETAKQYAVGLIQEIERLSSHAYGDNARRVHFKKHTIIYTAQGKTVIIRRILASALIKE